MPGRRGTGSARASPAAPPARPAARRSCRHRLAEQLRQRRRLVAERDELGAVPDRRQHRGRRRCPRRPAAAPRRLPASMTVAGASRDQSGAGPRYRMSTNRCGTLARSSASSPASTIRPCSMITTSWHRSWTRSSWWLENSTVAPSAARPDSSSPMALHGDRVQAGERLVEHQQVGFVDQRGDQLDPLLVTVRQRVQAVRRPPGQAEPLQPGIHAAGHVLRRCARTAGRGRRAGPAPASADTGPAPPACTRTGPGPRRRPARLATGPSPRPARPARTPRAWRWSSRPRSGRGNPVSRPGRAENVHRSRAVTRPNRFVTPSKSSICHHLRTENRPPGQRPVEADDPSERDQ